MCRKSNIQLDYASVLQVPFQNYQEDFTFIVNGEEFPTTQLISDLLSPKIGQIHSIDPTFSKFAIETQNKGNFSHILQLINFQKNEIEDIEIPFMIEVFEILCNSNIKVEDTLNVELTKENIIEKLQKHEQNQFFFSELYKKEIEFISTVMGELLSTRESDLMNLKIETLLLILNNEHLKIGSEDDLLQFVNKLYMRDVKYSILYEYVYFCNVTSSSIKEFIEIYDVNDITDETWRRFCERFEIELQKSFKMNKRRSDRYTNVSANGKTFDPNESDPFCGIINYLRGISNGRIIGEIEVSASSVNTNDECYKPETVALKENPFGWFASDNIEDSWLEIDFKKHRIIPSAYSIRSYQDSPNNDHLRNWVIEVSNDHISWEIIDNVENCSYLNGDRFVHTFKIKQVPTDEFRYFRIRQAGQNWGNCDYLAFETIDIYGTLIDT